jgi:hypothetical protein
VAKLKPFRVSVILLYSTLFITQSAQAIVPHHDKATIVSAHHAEELLHRKFIPQAIKWVLRYKPEADSQLLLKLQEWILKNDEDQVASISKSMCSELTKITIQKTVTGAVFKYVPRFPHDDPRFNLGPAWEEGGIIRFDPLRDEKGNLLKLDQNEAEALCEKYGATLGRKSKFRDLRLDLGYFNDDGSKRTDFTHSTFIPDLDLGHFWTKSLAKKNKAYIFSGISGLIYTVDRNIKANVICQTRRKDIIIKNNLTRDLSFPPENFLDIPN